MLISKTSAREKSAPEIKDGLSLTFFNPKYESQKNESGFQFVPVKANKIAVNQQHWQPAKKWDAKGVAFKASVKKSTQYVKNVQTHYTKLSSNWTKLVEELQVAQIQLSNQGTHNGYSFDSYCKNINLAVSTAYRWLKLAREAKLNPREKATLEQKQAFAEIDKKFKFEKAMTKALIHITKSEHFEHEEFQEYIFNSEEFQELVEKHWDEFDTKRKIEADKLKAKIVKQAADQAAENLRSMQKEQAKTDGVISVKKEEVETNHK